MNNITVYCNNCGFSSVGPDKKDYVLEAGGHETQIGYPCTVERYKLLVGNKPIIKRYGLLCLTCGTVGYYGPHDLDAPEDEHQSLLCQGRYTCISCGNHSFFPMVGKRLSFLMKLFSLVGMKTRNISDFCPDLPKCPRCKSGRLRSTRNIIV